MNRFGGRVFLAMDFDVQNLLRLPFSRSGGSVCPSSALSLSVCLSLGASSHRDVEHLPSDLHDGGAARMKAILG